MHMVRHNHIPINGHMKMHRDVLHDCIDNLTAGGKVGFGRFVNRPYDKGAIVAALKVPRFLCQQIEYVTFCPEIVDQIL